MRYTLLCLFGILALTNCSTGGALPDTRGADIDVKRTADGEPNEKNPALMPAEAVRFLALRDADSNTILQTDRDAIYRAAAANAQSFQQPVPRGLHRILNPNERPGAWNGYDAWQDFAATRGYTLEEWDTFGSSAHRLTVSPAVTEAVEAAQAAGRDDVANQILALSVLASQGGILIGPQASPPRLHGAFLDFADLTRMEGLVVATNQRARRVGGASLYLTTALLAASPEHPWVRQMADQAPTNVLQLLAAGHKNWAVRYYAGNTFLSRNLAGFYGVLPFTYLQAVGVFPAAIEETPEDALD